MSVADMVDMENQIGELVDSFEEKMKILFEEDPGLFEGRSTEAEWKAQVSNYGLDLQEELHKVMERFEAKLHGGDYHVELRDWQKRAGCHVS